MGRFLLLVVLVVVAIWLVRRALARPQPGPQAGTPASAGQAQGNLVKCAHCGTHLPLAEARAVGDRLYCSDEHARLGPGGG
jgi:uncharacterized protein